MLSSLSISIMYTPLSLFFLLNIFLLTFFLKMEGLSVLIYIY